MIIDASMQYEGRGWMGYDGCFWQIAAADPSRKWSSLDNDLWNMSFAGLARSTVYCQHCLMSSHTSEVCVYLNSQQGPPGMKKFSDIPISWEAPVCKSWNFSPSQKCSFHGCKFQHICIHRCEDPTLSKAQVAHKEYVAGEKHLPVVSITTAHVMVLNDS